MREDLSKIAYQASERWLQHAVTDGRPGRDEQDVRKALLSDAPFSRVENSALRSIGYFHGVRATVYLGRGAHEEARLCLGNAIAFKALGFLLQAAVPHPKQPRMLPLPIQSGLAAAGPCVSGWWSWADQCADWLARVAESNQRLYTDEGRIDSWGRGTSDAFLIALFADALQVKTTYTPVRPLHAAYAEVLAHWRTLDEPIYRQAMQGAAVYHESQCQRDAGAVQCEFDSPPDWVFPMELIAVQSLRRREGLPAFQTGNAIVDAAWAVAQDLRLSDCSPLVLQTAARLQSDYPQLQDLIS